MKQKDRKIQQLYKRYLHAKKRLEQGNESRDYHAIIEDLKWQIDELLGNNITDGIVSLKEMVNPDDKIIYDVLLLEQMKKIGIITYNNGKLNYKFEEHAIKKGHDLRALKLVVEELKAKGIEKLYLSALREDKMRNNTLSSIGAKKDLTSITPYNEYTLKLK